MIKSIKVKKDSFEEDILLFSEVNDLKNVNILFGGNGVGKSTLLSAIKEDKLDIEYTKEYEVLSYVNSLDNHRIKEITPWYKREEILNKINSKEMSEGQSILNSLLPFIEDVKNEAFHCNHESKNLVVLLDEIDSGLSAENINMFCHLLSELLQEHKNVQFFIATNAYHFAHVFHTVLNMYTGKFSEINSYEQFFGMLGEQMPNLGAKRELKFLKHF